MAGREWIGADLVHVVPPGFRGPDHALDRLDGANLCDSFGAAYSSSIRLAGTSAASACRCQEGGQAGMMEVSFAPVNPMRINFRYHFWSKGSPEYILLKAGLFLARGVSAIMQNVWLTKKEQDTTGKVREEILAADMPPVTAAGRRGD